MQTVNDCQPKCEEKQIPTMKTIQDTLERINNTLSVSKDEIDSIVNQVPYDKECSDKVDTPIVTLASLQQQATYIDEQTGIVNRLIHQLRNR